ncbi:MAG: ComF family protein [Acidaminococcaceae bacterium]
MPSFWQLFISIFFPPACIECGQRISEGMFCSSCRRKSEDFRILRSDEYCGPDIESICLFYRYDAGIKQALHDVKFHGKKSLLAVMSEEMMILETPKRVCKIWRLPENIFVVPIPTDRKRVAERGYDVPNGIFRHWALTQGFVWYEALSRIRSTQPQYGLNRNERRKNVRDCFSTIRNVYEKQILLVDDIFTSGATVDEAAHVLRKQGAGRIWVMTFAGGADGGK